MDLPGTGAIEFTEKNSLPCAQGQSAFLHGHSLRWADKARFDMGRGVALRMAVRLLPGDHLVQHHQDIFPDTRVGMLIDGHRRRGVGDEKETGSVRNAFEFQGLLHLRRDVDHLGYGIGFYDQGFVEHAYTLKKKKRPYASVKPLFQHTDFQKKSEDF